MDEAIVLIVGVGEGYVRGFCDGGDLASRCVGGMRCALLWCVCSFGEGDDAVLFVVGPEGGGIGGVGCSVVV